MIDERRFEELNAAVLQLLRRQFDLEQRLARLEGTSSPVPEPQYPSPVTAPVLEEPPAPTTPLRGIAPDAPQPDAIAARELEGSPAPEPPPDGHPALETKVGLTIINRIGVITLILGVAFFFKWAVDNEWIGPPGRVLLGLLAGFAALGVSDYLHRKSQRIFAQGTTGAGLAILYLSVYAAFSFYHLIPQPVAFAFMASSTALAYALSLRYDSAAIAVLGFLGGYATPLLLSSGGDHSWFLLSYLLLLDFAAMRLAKGKGWRPLEVLAFVATALIYFTWFDSSYSHRGTLVATLGALAYYALFSYAGSPLLVLAAQVVAAVQVAFIWAHSPVRFFSLELLLAAAGLGYWVKASTSKLLGASFFSFWLATTIFLIGAFPQQVGATFLGLSAGFLLFLFSGFLPGVFGHTGPRSSTRSLWVLASNGILYFALTDYMLRGRYDDWLGLLAVVTAATYVGLAVLLRRESQNGEQPDPKPLLVSLGMAMAFVTLAIPIQLTGFHITIGWAIEAAALTWIAVRLRSDRALWAAAAILVLVAARLIVFDRYVWSGAPPLTLLVNTRFTTFVLCAAAAFLAAKWAAGLDRKLAFGEYILANLILLAGLTMEMLLWAQHNSTPASRLSVETVSISILYALYALLLIGVGVASRTSIHRLAGLALTAFVILKLYAFDVWQLDRVYRITAFVVLGLVLISTSFLYSRFRPVIDSLLRNDEASH